MRDWAENQVTLALVRHGETRANRERRYLGKTDESLSPEGIQGLLSQKANGCYPEVGCLFSSPMKRCIETAGILYPQLAPILIPEWEEMDFGRFEYKNYKELQGDAQYQAWVQSGGILDFPEGENRDSFILRCEKGLGNLCRELERMAGRQGGRPAQAGAVLHGGTIMALLSSFGGREYFSSQAKNGRGYLCRMEWQEEHVTGKVKIQIEVVTEI